MYYGHGLIILYPGLNHAQNLAEKVKLDWVSPTNDFHKKEVCCYQMTEAEYMGYNNRFPPYIMKMAIELFVLENN